MAPNALDLTTLAAVKNRAEVVSTNDDAEIQAAITGFSQHILDCSGQATLNSIASLDEIYDGNGNSRMFLRSYPIINVASVTMCGAGLPASTSWNQWGFYVDQSKKSIALRGGIGNFSTFPYPNTYLSPYGYGRGPVFMRGQGNIEVIYSAGYGPTEISNEIDAISAQTITLQKGPWSSDAGVLYYPSLAPLENVPNSPGIGQYSVANGLYVFNAGDNGNVVAVSYSANLAPVDLEYAVRCIVAINYKRKAWQDQASRTVSLAGGGAMTTRYRDWDIPVEWVEVLQYFQRKAII